jgi:hypothetical protein
VCFSTFSPSRSPQKNKVGKKMRKCFPSCCCRGRDGEGGSEWLFVLQQKKYGFGKVLIFAVI